ncbi:MAG: protein-disulfide isomerase [Thaumarchaeota archaeon]|nr:MAG: protein-disulfide isomerase [Nitrososphaerota archaeon]
MGRKDRKEREIKRESYATKHSAEKRKQTLIAIGVLIVGYAGYLFLTMTVEAPGGPENAGALGSEHAHAGILVKIFGDEFDFSAPAYQIKSPWIHFESRDGSTVHKHATGVELEYLFNSLSIGLDDQCYVFPDGKQFCTNDEYSLKYFINEKLVSDIRDYEIMDDDKILITFGGETNEQIEDYLTQLRNQELIK